MGPEEHRAVRVDATSVRADEPSACAPYVEAERGSLEAIVETTQARRRVNRPGASSKQCWCRRDSRRSFGDRQMDFRNMGLASVGRTAKPIPATGDCWRSGTLPGPGGLDVGRARLRRIAAAGRSVHWTQRQATYPDAVIVEHHDRSGLEVLSDHREIQHE